MSIAASRYARALLDVLYPNMAERGLEQLQRFSAVLAAQPEAQLVLENPTVPTERRKDLVEKIGNASGMDAPVRNFLGLLVERNRLEILSEVVSAYSALLDEKQGVVRAKVTSALELDTAERERIAAQLKSLTGKNVRMEVAIDPSLIGGLVAQVGSTIYDGSIRSRLQTFRNHLIQN